MIGHGPAGDGPAPGMLGLTVAARSENVAVVRQALTALGESAGLNDVQIGDLKTAATEACMNAVVHAYAEHPGPIEIEAASHEGSLFVRIADRGRGFEPRPATGASLRLGIPLIAALSDGFSISGRHGGGTEVTIRIDIGADDASEDSEETDTIDGEGPEARLRFGGHGLPVGSILSRVLGTFAARADLSIDRLSDTVILGEAVSAHRASDFADGIVTIAVDDGGAGVELRVGPLLAGAGARLLEALDAPGLPPGAISGLATSSEVEQADDGSETVVLKIDG